MKPKAHLRLVKERGQAPCWGCNRTRSLNERYDSYCCTYCDMWLESDCDDAQCAFCKTRPRKPSLV